jgi:hypothetical protein
MALIRRKTAGWSKNSLPATGKTRRQKANALIAIAL